MQAQTILTRIKQYYAPKMDSLPTTDIDEYRKTLQTLDF